MKITRRKLAASTILTASALAQTRQNPTESEADLLKGSRELVQRISEFLAKYEIPMATEPAFQFKP
jgi:hypothetical protein